MNLKRTLAALSAAALVAFPAGAMAKKSDHSGSDKGGKGAEQAKPKKPKKPKMATYVFKGTVAAKGEGTVQVTVVHGNSRGKKLKGQTLTFDLAGAKLKVDDVNGDGKRDLGDVAVGDRAQVQAKLPAGPVDAGQALPARHVAVKAPEAPKAPEVPEVPEVPETPPAT